MSPYYKAVATGTQAVPRDWCGVFVSLHERQGDRKGRVRWRERAYAYNLYRGGVFDPARPNVRIGDSCLSGAADEPGGPWRWRVAVSEPGLWRGRTEATLMFTTIGRPPVRTPRGDNNAAHSWVLVAPRCHVSGTLTLPGELPRRFAGTGYHDHNFGQLPFGDADAWYWGRARLDGTGGEERIAVFYHLEAPDQSAQTTLLLFGPNDEPLAETGPAACTLSRPIRYLYGMEHAARLELRSEGQDSVEHVVTADLDGAPFSRGPFYQRLPLNVAAQERRGDVVVWRGSGKGIGEFFRPARLCGPTVSRAMWSRIRRRGASFPGGL